MSDTLAEQPTGDGSTGDRPDPLTDPLADPLTDPLPDPEATAAPVTATGTAPTTGPRRESVVCPECGTRAEATLTRRDSVDFCGRCDFPLFWTPSTIQLGDRDTDEATLRRLPGTGGRVTVASAACPHCNEANALSASVCVRCGRSMAIEDPPPPVVAPAPPPPPASVPEPRTPWWVWVGLGLTGALLSLLVVWLIVR